MQSLLQLRWLRNHLRSHLSEPMKTEVVPSSNLYLLLLCQHHWLIQSLLCFTAYLVIWLARSQAANLFLGVVIS